MGIKSPCSVAQKNEKYVRIQTEYHPAGGEKSYHS